MSLESFFKTETLDEYCAQLVDDNYNLLVPWYLIASYAYYVEDKPILSDQQFDRLAKRLLEHWDEVEHRHKDYLNLDMISAGTYMGDYPPQTQGAVAELRKTLQETKPRKQLSQQQLQYPKMGNK